jgi:hypothetical protein|tara:strand:- start:8155 stop:8991 length:837 start_codon:yes stop_codon:yes gene_type:complete
MPGSTWAYGNDIDSWAFCTGSMKIAKAPGVVKDNPVRHWIVTQKFSTEIPKRCNTTTIDNPLLEPMGISGSFVKYTQEVMKDKDDNPVHNSAFELIRGPQVEFDANRPTVKVTQNIASLGLNVFSEMIDKVNDAPLWGLAARKVKLSNVSWERLYYGSCFAYYSRSFDFDINFDTFDRAVLDEGTKALGRLDPTTGAWDSTSDFATGVPIDADNPIHFTRYKDKHGENARVILDGLGVPITAIAGTGTGTGAASLAGTIDIQYYGEANFLSLGIPTSL